MKLKEFEYQNLFNAALKNGISLFCGAGFSVEATDTKGLKLPIGNNLLKELKERFASISEYSNLPRACTKLEKSEKSEFYSFLKNRFSVSNFNQLYSELLHINLKNIYTTNIDDIFFKIFEKSKDGHYLNDVSENGIAFKKDSLAVNYFPLHGCIRNGNDKYVFGVTDIASAFSRRGTEKSWESLAKDVSNLPILFWGWNFEDSGPIEAMYGNKNNIEDNINRWVLLYEPNKEMIDFLKSLNFNIIIGETSQLLQYLSDFNKSNNIKNNIAVNGSISKQLRNYLPPKNNERLPSYPLRTFFVDYTPHWSHIYSNKIPKIIFYKKIADYIFSKKDIIVIGIRGSGKTTLMMQLLIGLNINKTKHYMIAPSLEQVRSYLRSLNNANSILFIDDCFRDTNAFLELLRSTNVQVIGFDRDFNYEGQFYRLKNESFEYIDITEIEKGDAQSIIDIIPNELKKENTSIKYFEEDPTIPNLLAINLKAVNFNFIGKFYKKDPISADVFLMICYVHACGVPCSFDMIYSYLGDDKYNWKEMMDAINRVGGLVKEFSDFFGAHDVIDSIQNYYQCRSRFFAEKIIDSIPKGNLIFKEVLLNFAQYVPLYKIYWYDKFKRRGYDADFAIIAFPDVKEGEDYYKICAKKDENEYIFQQAAIYFSRKKEYRKAFDWIDMARNLTHYNHFSIDSTYAKIYFDVNINADKSQALQALDILSNCCARDERKFIHFLTFSERVLQFYEKYKDNSSYEYLKTALNYVNEGISSANLALSQKNKLALRNIKNKLKDTILINEKSW